LRIALQEAIKNPNSEDDIDPKMGQVRPGMYSEFDSDLPVELEGSDPNSAVLKPLQTLQ